jgi:membrane protein DedA with SNARE-associated domain
MLGSLSAPDSSLVPTAPPDYSPTQLRNMRLWFGVLAVLGIAGWAGTLGVARLANDLPLLLIVLSPVNRHLVLVAPTVHPALFLGVAIARGLLSCLVGFQLGRLVGKPGLRWLDGNSPGMGRFVRWAERLFERSAPVAILVFPNLIVSLLAGISGMGSRPLLGLAFVGLTLRMLAILGFALWFREEIAWLLHAFDRYWIPITLALVALVVLYQLHRRGALRRVR